MACKAKRAAAARDYMAVKAMTRLAIASPAIKTNWQDQVEKQEQKKMKKSLKKLLLASAAVEELGAYASNRRVLDKHIDLLSAAADLAEEVNADGKVANRFDIPEKCIPAARRGIKDSRMAADKTGGWEAVKADYLHLQCDKIDKLVAAAEKPAMEKPASPAASKKQDTAAS